MLTEYQPTTPEEFLGPARKAAEAVLKLAHQAKAGRRAIKLLFNGPPGTGKSSLAKFTIAALGATKFSTHKFNGTDVNIAIVQELRMKLGLCELFGDYRVIHVDEADKIPHVAQVAFLTLLDDLPPGNAVLCTSNCRLEEFEQRFQTRFQQFQILGPDTAEIYNFLIRHGAPKAQANQIATFACGNVRQAFLDAASAMAMAA